MAISAKTFACTEGLEGISARQMQEHYTLYTGYVAKVNELTDQLGKIDRSMGNATYAPLREIKIELAFAINGVKSHELFFGGLTRGGTGGPQGPLLEHIARGFGGFDALKAELTGTVMSARGWAWLAWDRYFDRLAIYLGDTHHTYPIWDAAPVFAFDAYEHAYFLDFGTARPRYIEAVLANMDWHAVERCFESAMAGKAVTRAVGEPGTGMGKAA